MRKPVSRHRLTCAEDLLVHAVNGNALVVYRPAKHAEVGQVPYGLAKVAARFGGYRIGGRTTGADSQDPKYASDPAPETARAR